MKHIVNDWPLIIAESRITKNEQGNPYHCVHTIVAYLTDQNAVTGEITVRILSLSPVEFDKMANKIAMIKYEYVAEDTPIEDDLPF